MFWLRTPGAPRATGGHVCGNFTSTPAQDRSLQKAHGLALQVGVVALQRDIFHTYSAYARGIEPVVGTYGYLDLVPKGRDEDGLPFTISWVRHPRPV